MDLDDRTTHILRLRSGMLDGAGHTRREVGEEIGLKAERVRQLENEGLALIAQLREVQRHLRSEPAIRARYRWREPR